ncbi:hypothetical protein OQJ19_17065 [Fluoribacter gormanii]|uniref:hypothetical protein n=1 Tax=Fluoribacter gormanii TaxID=464 RepID=UPI0022441716|nr:hypothetical protein [Fluoribacter gormanii]MCW8472344.1 hypothetical protein [Fluoribacter gormanii]
MKFFKLNMYQFGVLLLLFLICILLAIPIYQNHQEHVQAQKIKEEEEAAKKNALEIDKYQQYINNYFIKKYEMEALTKAATLQRYISEYAIQNNKLPANSLDIKYEIPPPNQFYSIEIGNNGIIIGRVDNSSPPPTCRDLFAAPSRS